MISHRDWLVRRPYPWATQFQIIHETCVKENVVDIEDPRVVWVGLPLDMAAAILECLLSPQGYTVQSYHIDPAKMDKYTTKKIIRDAVLDPQARVMINYDRGNIGQGTFMTGWFEETQIQYFQNSDVLSHIHR